jgi:hypothetical protein
MKRLTAVSFQLAAKRGRVDLRPGNASLRMTKRLWAEASPAFILFLESNFASMMGGSKTRPLYINYKGTINKLTDDTRSIKIIISGETEAGSAGEQPA